jgi:hypothetical protein
MTNRVCRFAVCFSLAAATLAGPLAGLAHARDDDRARGDRAQGDRAQGDRAQGDRVQGDRTRGDRAQGHERSAWREGYYRRPDVYYSAPPVVSPPYGYYQQPGASFSLTIPFR